MDILRLPGPIRRSLIHHAQFKRLLTTHNSYDQDQYHPFVPPPAPDASPALLTLSSSTLNSYAVSLPPNKQQLKYASTFFRSTPPHFLFSAAHFRAFPPSSFPEVAFLGRSNVGKSSLLNALVGRTNVKDAHVSKRPGRTRTMNGFGVSGGLALGAAKAGGQKDADWKRFPRGGLVVVDMPGYGAASQEEWGKEALKYLGQRKQLRRAFVLVDAEHGLKGSDVTILTHMRQEGISHQVVLSKVDKLLCSGNRIPGPERLNNKLLKLGDLCVDIQNELDAAAADGRKRKIDILCCSSEKGLDEHDRSSKLGVNELRWTVLSACGMQSDEMGQRTKQRLDFFDVVDSDA